MSGRMPRVVNLVIILIEAFCGGAIVLDWNHIGERVGASDILANS